MIPLLRCRYGTHQGTDERGRPTTKVRLGQVECEADMPRHTVLVHWAAHPSKRLEAVLIWRHAVGGAALETLHLKAAYCVAFGLFFREGDQHTGAYTCHFTLSDPDGWDWYPGGPRNEAAIRPAAREHGSPPVTTPVVASEFLLQRPLLKNAADPVHDLFGPGRLSHPEEWTHTLQQLRAEGVEIIHRKGAMAYGPSPASDKPGQLLLDEDASIGALRHETRHYKDDKALGFPGAIRYYQEPELR